MMHARCCTSGRLTSALCVVQDYNRQLRAQQDAEYEESLRADRVRAEREAALQEAAAREAAELAASEASAAAAAAAAERAAQEREAALAARQAAKASAMAQEPPAGPGVTQVCNDTGDCCALARCLIVASFRLCCGYQTAPGVSAALRAQMLRFPTCTTGRRLWASRRRLLGAAHQDARAMARCVLDDASHLWFAQSGHSLSTHGIRARGAHAGGCRSSVTDSAAGGSSGRVRVDAALRNASTTHTSVSKTRNLVRRFSRART